MDTPKFKHDCDSCKFLGHYFGYDVYYCPGDSLGGLGSLIARNGDDGPDYSSHPLKLLQGMIANRDHRIAAAHENWNMPFQDYVFSDKVSVSTKAMVVGVFCKCHELFK